MPKRSLTRRRPSPSARSPRWWWRRRSSRRSWRAWREAGAADGQAAAAGGLQQLPGAATLGALVLGFLKVEPNVLIPFGCASRRRPRISASVARTAAGSPGSAGTRRATTSPGRRLERGRRSRAAPGRGARPRARWRPRPIRAPAQLAAVGVGVHPHRPAGGAGDVDAELDPGEPPAGGAGRGGGQPCAAAAQQAARPRARSSRARRQLDRETAESLVGRPAGSSRSRPLLPPAPRLGPAQEIHQPLGSPGGRTTRRRRRSAPSSAAPAGTRRGPRGRRAHLPSPRRRLPA